MPAPTTEWLAQQYHTGRIDLPNAHRYIPSENEVEALEHAFKTLADDVSGELRLQKTSLITCIQSQLPKNVPTTFADHVYRIFAYHSTAPLYHAPDTPAKEFFTLLDVERALVWLLPNRHLRMGETGNMGRMRTPADGHRLLFQSLATRSVATASDPILEATRRRYAHRNAYDANHVREEYGWTSEDVDEQLDDWCKTNRDDDGDEMYHDLLDVLHHNVPENFPYGSMRDDLRPLATELKIDVVFHSLAIPKADLVELVQALLVLQFEPGESGDVRWSDETVASVMATFTCDDNEIAAAFPLNDDLVAWPAFDCGLQKLTSHLFDPVYRVLVAIFLDGKTDGTYIRAPYDVPPELQTSDQHSEPHVLSPRWMALVPGILPEIVNWEDLHTVLRWHRTSGSQAASESAPDKDAIWTQVHTHPLAKRDDPRDAVILAFSGRDRVSGEPFRGGVIFATDYEDDGNGGRVMVYSLHVFRLAPSIRCTKLARQEWRQDPNGELGFGVVGSKFSLRVYTMVAEFALPEFGPLQTIEVDALEVWNDSER